MGSRAGCALATAASRAREATFSLACRSASLSQKVSAAACPSAAVEHHQHSLEARLPLELWKLLLAELVNRVVDPFGRQAGEPAQPDVHGTLLTAQTPSRNRLRRQRRAVGDGVTRAPPAGGARKA
jgi:hypothetical protein